MISPIKKFIGATISIITLSVAAVFAITSIGESSPFKARGDNNVYQLVLDDKNAVSSSGTYAQTSKTGGVVEFTYTSASASSGNHVALASGGTIVNKDIIHSITSFSAVFSGELQARVSYKTSTWGEYFNLVSGQSIDLGSNPYFLELKASTNVVLSSATYNYSCAVNDAAEEQDTKGSYVINFKTHSSDDTAQITSDSGIKGEIEDASLKYISSASGSRVFQGKHGLKFSSSSYNGSIALTLNTSNVKEKITSIDFVSVGYGSDSWSFNVYLNDSNTACGNISTEKGSVSANVETLTMVEVYATNRFYLSSITLNYGAHTEPSVPTKDEIGFTASDANKDIYTTNSIFDNDNALSVAALFSDGTQTSLSKGAEGYSYVVKDANEQVINTAEKFASEGVYSLIVSYKNYIPVEIQLLVGEYIYIEDVTASMSTTTFNTADVLNNNLNNNLVATASYSNNTTQENIAVGAFAEYNLGFKLLNPKGISHDYTKVFGVAGNWTLMVYRLDDENVYFNISLTVNAIPVETITLNETSYNLYPEGTLQLLTTVNPTTATNPSVEWSSNNEPIATVDENGLVTAVSVGIAKITATAADGSNVIAECTINVIAKPAEPSYSIVTTNSTLKNGDVVAVRTKESSPEGVTGFNDNKDATVSTTKSEWVEFVIGSASNSGWTLRDTDASQYIASPSANEFKYSTTGGTCSVDSEGHIVCNSRYLCKNGTFYRFYSSIGSFTPFYVFKIGEGSSAAPVYPTSISVTGTSSITIGQTSQLTVSYNPGDTNVKNVTFSSSNESVATVSSSGLVTGVTNGNARITATAEAASGTVTNYIDITVNPVSVTGISLNETGASVKVGKTVTLVPTITPANATNKNVTWTSSDTSVATVSSGIVSGIAPGNATITVKTVDGNKTATCAVTVESSSSSAEETFSITYTDLPSSYQTGSTVYTASSGIKFQAYNCAGGYSSKMQFKANGGYLQTTESLELQKLIINDRESNTLTVYGSNTAGSFTTEITGTNDVYDLTGYNYLKVIRSGSGAGYCNSLTVTTGTPTPTDPTGISISPSSADMAPGTSKELVVTYIPSNANQNKEVTWTSSNTSVATVDANGKVTVKSTASEGQTATITAKLTNLPSITATFTVTVVAQQVDDHTVLIYICGADLESENQLATGDIQEILSVSGQPDDVNIVIETGGAKSWSSKYGISSSNLERWHVENKKLVRDESLTYASMGLSSTLQSFIEYGLNNYPAERTGLVLWNHGGGMRGVCYDEKKSDDSLLNNEVKSAVSGAMNNCGKSGEKLEWIGYDACLMQVQDIADFNSSYFNYMIASEESEAGYGWDYDTWVDDLYAHKNTTSILTAIVDGFIRDNGGASSSSGDQTLSYLDLAYMSAYKTAWEAMATQLQSKLTSSNKSSFNTAIINNVKHYADSDYDYFCTFDAKDFINKLASDSAFSSFRIDSSYTDEVLTAHANLVKYSVAQKGAGNSYGLCMYWVNNKTYSDMSFYTTSQTNFTVWRNINNTYGTHK